MKEYSTQNLGINFLSLSQFEALANPDPAQLWMVPADLGPEIWMASDGNLWKAQFSSGLLPTASGISYTAVTYPQPFTRQVLAVSTSFLRNGPCGDYRAVASASLTAASIARDSSAAYWIAIGI